VVEVDGVEQLPAAVEVAAYRIAVEALTNVARHTDRPEARVLLRRAGDDLVVEVTDRSPGSGTWRAGVGLSSTRERAEELGGSLVSGATSAGGCLRAELPLGQASSR
jgi:two-component system NarL family sensor kinase